MKKILFIITVMLLGCSSNEPKITANALEGQWILARKTGGIAGINETPKEGEKSVLFINNDSSFYFENNGVKGKQGTYKLGTKKAMLFNKKMKTIELGEGNEFLYEIKDNTLDLIQDYYDGFNYEYHRLN